MTPDSMIRFTMSGQTFSFDIDLELLVGDEVMLIEQHTGQTVPDWIRRLGSMQWSGTDLVLLAYLAKHRENPLLEWQFFAPTVAPYTVRILDDVPTAEKPKAAPATSAAQKPRRSTSRAAAAAS